MLAKKFHITKTKDFKIIKKEGKTLVSENFILTFLDRKDNEVSRFGFVVPNKIFSLAHDRTRVKRMLNESTRFQLSYLKPGFDCVFLPKQNILRAYSDLLMKEVEEAFRKAELFK